MGNRISAVATRTGDDGTTGLGDGTRVAKDSLRIAALAWGGESAEQWGVATRAVDFFDVKGDLEALVAPRTLTTYRSEHTALHPGRCPRILVDGEYASTTPTAYPDDGNLYLTRVDFQGARKARHIRIETIDMRFGGVQIGPGDSISPAPKQGNVRAIALGDSITEGMSGYGYNFENYATRLGHMMGWKDMYVSGVGSTGYLAAPFTKLKFRDRMATDVYPFSPHVLLIAGEIGRAHV